MKTWLMMALLVSANTIAQAQAPEIASPHNLAPEPGADANESCMTCHTPFGDGGDAAPLWQQDGERSDRGFRIVDTMGRTVVSSSVYGNAGSVSLACLACHDGSQADAGQGMDTSAEYREHAHPVGVEYARGRFGSQTGQLPDVDVFAQPLRPREEYHTPQQAEVDGHVIWWLGDSSMRRKEDIQLYSRAGQSGPVPYIECASCHDPHSPHDSMLRRENAGSAVCLSCHSM